MNNFQIQKDDMWCHFQIRNKCSRTSLWSEEEDLVNNTLEGYEISYEMNIK
jgi:hypothetical protein